MRTELERCMMAQSAASALVNLAMDVQLGTNAKLSGSDMVKAGCNGCGGCCKGMGQSIVLDPLDIFRMTSNLKCTFEMLLQDKVELGVVDGLILPNLKMNGENKNTVPFFGLRIFEWRKSL